MLEVKNVHKSFRQRRVFDDFSLTMTAQRLRLKGKNGSGKSTLLLMIAGLEATTSGEVTFHDMSNQSLKFKESVGISSESIAIPPFLTGEQIIDIHCKKFNANINQALIKNFGLTPFLAMPFDTLSLGNKKKLTLLLSTMHEPQLLLLDEPFNGLDAKGIQIVSEFITQYPGHLVLASHADDPMYEDWQVCDLDNQ